MKTLLMIITVIVSTPAFAAHMDYVSFCLNLDAVKAIRSVFPVCEKPTVKTEEMDGLLRFVITQACKIGPEVETGTPNKSVDLILTGSSAPWGEIGDVEVKVSRFCAGNCEN